VTQAPPSAAPPAKPSLELLRSLTDEHVLRALMQARRLTRADLATDGGCQADGRRGVRGDGGRAAAASGRRTPGPAAAADRSYYPGGPSARRRGQHAPDGVVAEAVDAFGDTVATPEAIEGQSGPHRSAALLGAAAGSARPGPHRGSPS
jgi:hypothetical protein